MNVDNPEVITVLSLCTGYGGLELGLSRALANPLRVVAVEVEAYALANLVAKAEAGKLAVEALWPDLRTFPAERFRGCFDFIIAGYPCQPFSVAGKRAGEDDPRHLWPSIAGIVSAVRPVWCFFENVAGHLTLGFPAVYRSLRDMGYRVETILVAAAECGPDANGNFCPHRRERLFILAKSGRTRPSSKQAGRQNNGRASDYSVGASSHVANASRATSGNQGGQADGRTRQEDVQQGHRQTGAVRLGATGQLADAEYPRARKGTIKEAPAGIRGAGPAINSATLADTAAQQIQRAITAGPALSRRPPDEQGIKWPARPGQPQYDWEEPRTVKSDVGCTVDGFSARVDMLKLLGNGVVPQQAEKAFRYLMEIHMIREGVNDHHRR